MIDISKEQRECDRLRFKAFKTNAADDLELYYKATSKWFQGEAGRILDRSYVTAALQARVAELEGGFINILDGQKTKDTIFEIAFDALNPDTPT